MRLFINPEIKFYKFDFEDVITTSLGDEDNGLGWLNL